MIVAIVRHAKVDIERNFLETSAEYEKRSRDYDTAPVLPVTVKLPDVEFRRVYVSALSRTEATARQVLGDREMDKTALINEVPGCAPFDANVKLPVFFWEAAGRTQWFMNVRRQPETREETVRRAEKFVDLLIGRGEDCAVFSHGFFMITLLQVMKKRGFVPDHTKLSYRNGECVVCRRES